MTTSVAATPFYYLEKYRPHCFRDMIGNGDERQLLMYLQEEGWNAPQSRAIINMARKEWN